MEEPPPQWELFRLACGCWGWAGDVSAGQSARPRPLVAFDELHFRVGVEHTPDAEVDLQLGPVGAVLIDRVQLQRQWTVHDRSLPKASQERSQALGVYRIAK